MCNRFPSAPIAASGHRYFGVPIEISQAYDRYENLKSAPGRDPPSAAALTVKVGLLACVFIVV